MTAEMRRKAALDRKNAREERAFGARREREEIFEVGVADRDVVSRHPDGIGKEGERD